MLHLGRTNIQLKDVIEMERMKEKKPYKDITSSGGLDLQGKAE